MTANSTQHTPLDDLSAESERSRAALAAAEQGERLTGRRRSTERQTFLSFTRATFAVFTTSAVLFGGATALVVQIAVQIRSSR